MQEVNVELPVPAAKSYKIHVGSGAIRQLGSLFELAKYSKLFVVTDEAAAPSVVDKLLPALPAEPAVFRLPAGENHKDLQSVSKIWQAMHAAGCDRQSLVINLGGGLVSDLGGFAASTYMRGVDFLNVPTTLLSQVDASVGGKTGFNFDGVKNLIGTFSQPVGVLIDPDVLSSLPVRELAAGFAEIIKHGLIYDAAYFEKATSKPPKEFDQAELADLIVGSCRIKLAIIKDDIHEGGSRKLVNFGHSVGHAVEALSLYADAPLLHGEAVSIGMVAEAGIAVKLGLLTPDEQERIKGALAKAGLPVSVRGLDAGDILDKMRSDKKNTGGKLNIVLLDRIGHAVYDREVPEEAAMEIVRTIIES